MVYLDSLSFNIMHLCFRLNYYGCFGICSLPEVLIQKHYVLLKRLDSVYQDTLEDQESFWLAYHHHEPKTQNSLTVD